MKEFAEIIQGYQQFRDKYVHGDKSVMQWLSLHGQKPQIMVIACCDSRVDPALVLQCDPGDLFVVRNVANIVPPYENDEMHHGTSAALEFGINFLKVNHLILLGHSQCGGIRSLLELDKDQPNDFISKWVSVIKTPDFNPCNYTPDEYAKVALQQSYQNCLSFPWLNAKLNNKELILHLWYFDIHTGQIFTYNEVKQTYEPLNSQSQC